MGAKSSTSSCPEKIGTKYGLAKDDEKPQQHTRREKLERRAQHYEGKLKADAEEFVPSPPVPSTIPLSALGVSPILDGKYADQKDAPWVKFLLKKETERLRRAPAKGPVATPKQHMVLQTSEYLKLLKPSDSGSHARKKGTERILEKTKFPMPAARVMKGDVSAAVDEIIQSRSGEKSSAQLLSNDEALLNIVKMFESKGTSKAGIPAVSKRKIVSEVAESEDAEVATSQDDIMLEKRNRDEDLADPAYWSEDEHTSAPKKIHRASAHKLGRRPRNDSETVRDYVMQDLDFDLDHEVAKLLLHTQRLSNRHRSFEQGAPVRYFVTGLKEVHRCLKQGKVKSVFIAPDIEDSSSHGGVDDRLHDILRASYQLDVPVIFSLSRSRMGLALGKSLKMSVFGLLETKGINEQVEKTLALGFEKRKSWMEREPAKGPAPKASQSPTRPPGKWSSA